MRAVALSEAGAEAEALAELEKIKGGMEAEGRDRINRVLYAHYARTPASQKTEKVGADIKRYEKEQLERQERERQAAAAAAAAGEKK
jgi:hypothetical protein